MVEALAWNACKANLSRCVQTQDQDPEAMTILFAAFCVSSWSHLRNDARQVYTSLVNSATVSFVESECDVLRVYVRELLLVYLSRRSASQVSVTFLLNSLHSVG